MSAERPLDDDRWRDQEGHVACFMCAKRVDQLDPNRVTYALVPPDIRLDAHLQCLVVHFRGTQLDVTVEIAYRKALADMQENQYRRVGIH